MRVFHILSWSSQKSRRPAKSSCSAEILACGEAMDEENAISEALCARFKKEIPIVVVMDCEDLFNALSTQHSAADKLIWADFNVILYEFETHKI